jgi:toxin ParE1/3/4
MKVLWTEQALLRLSEIEEYIARDAPDRAIAFTEKLIRRGESLRDHPRAGQPVPELNSNEFREVLIGPYRIVYRLKTPRLIQILTVFEGRHSLPTEDFL